MYNEIEQLRKDIKLMLSDGWAQWKIAELTGLAQTTISSFVRGGTPSVRTLRELDCLVRSQIDK